MAITYYNILPLQDTYGRNQALGLSQIPISPPHNVTGDLTISSLKRETYTCSGQSTITVSDTNDAIDIGAVGSVIQLSSSEVRVTINTAASGSIIFGNTHTSYTGSVTFKLAGLGSQIAIQKVASNKWLVIGDCTAL